jgi:hypothetical protein
MVSVFHYCYDIKTTKIQGGRGGKREKISENPN